MWLPKRAGIEPLMFGCWRNIGALATFLAKPMKRDDACRALRDTPGSYRPKSAKLSDV